MNTKERFEKEFPFASFTWNGDNRTGEDFAKQTMRKMLKFIEQEITLVEQVKVKEVFEGVLKLSPEEVDYSETSIGGDVQAVKYKNHRELGNKQANRNWINNIKHYAKENYNINLE